MRSIVPLPYEPESRLWRLRVLIRWVPLAAATQLASRLSRRRNWMYRIFWWLLGYLEDLETETSIVPDAGFSFWVCLHNFWTIGPWEPEYMRDEWQ